MTKEIKTKINTWNLIKLESFCTVKETIEKLKIKLTELKKMFAHNDSVQFSCSVTSDSL